ncbi:SRR1-like protein [Anopheles nili]|uniref:SRR1-like protein n=1 Tax=Anopheles nili TaxID=185578 RepID=UPI00237BDF23|nr:SRR1-like protein [Anopheles nili]
MLTFDVNNAMSVANETEFKLVVPKKGKHRSKLRSNTRLPVNFVENSHGSHEQAAVCVQTLLTQLKTVEQDLLRSEFFEECFKNIHPVLVGVERIICLGLGSFHECTIARYQLALIRCLRDKANLSVKGEFFDPVFNRSEAIALQTLNETVLQENLEGKYIAERKTLFYLPHCPKQIVNNVLWRNWHPSRLRNVVLLCNSFSSVVNNIPQRLLQKSGGYILRAADSFVEVPIRNIFRFGDIFNDTSLHYLRPSDPTLGVATVLGGWDCAEEPSYEDDDIELISKKVVEALEFL